MPGASDRQTADQELLDEVFERTVARVEEGRPPEFTDLLAGREDLWPEAEKLIHLAQQVAVGQRPMLPKIDGYTILGELGRGGMGTVYLAQQERLGRRLVALKVLSSAVALSPSARERFRSEALAIARLRHPNIVAVHDVVHEAGVYAYAMEWVDGKSLADVIAVLRPRGDKSDIAELRAFLDAPAGVLVHDTLATFVCRVGIAIARALGAVHRAGLLHRDVKPGNILLRRDGTPLLTDFGLARGLDDVTVTQPGHFVGTPAYAAPEQLRGSTAALDAQTDVYGLGVTLYHALALRLPFSGGSTADLLRRIEAGQAEPLRHANPHLSADLQTIVAKAMDADPARRYQTADELADDLERLLNLQPIQARPAGLMTRTVKLARRNRPAVIGATLGGAIALILAVLVGGYVLVVPGWADARLREARLELLAPGNNDAIFAAVYWQHPGQKLLGLTDDYLRAPLGNYQAALRLRPMNQAIRLERDTVQLARDLAVYPERVPALPTSLQTRGDLTCVYARRLAKSSRFPHLESELLQRASSLELRCLGLVAYLCGDIDTALEAWSRMDLLTDPDPLVEASLGQLYLLLDQPARAYPRLRNAVRVFPEAGFLCVSLADAALQCGDLIKAEQLLDRARQLGGLDATLGLLRVQADLYAATGRDEQAIAIWSSPDAAQSVAQCHYGHYLEARGDFAGATRAYGFAGGIGRYRRAWDGFGRVAPRWWGELTDKERWRTLREALDQRRVETGRESIIHSLWSYAEYVLLPLKREGKSVAVRPGSLEAVALGLRATGRKGQLVRACHYPPWVKDLHTTSLLSPWPVSGSLVLASLDAAGRRLGLPGWPSDEPPE